MSENFFWAEPMTSTNMCEQASAPKHTVYAIYFAGVLFSRI